MQKNATGGSHKEELLLDTNRQLNSYFHISSLLNTGAFGQVYSGVNIEDGHRVAIKAERLNAEMPLLESEAKCLEALNRSIRRLYSRPREPIPDYFGYGQTRNVRYLVMDRCGSNLRELKKATPEDRFSINTSLWLMKKMICALQFLHKLDWIHRDVKPANFCIGPEMNGPQQLFLIDFGMARKYVNNNGLLKTRREYSAFHGTVRYASLTTHRHQDMSRYDDLWSVYYISVENMVGQLPWRCENDKMEVARLKESTDLHQLKFEKEACPPASLVVFHRHLCQADFYSEPKYDCILYEIELDMMQRNFPKNGLLDWQIDEKILEEAKLREPSLLYHLEERRSIEKSYRRSESLFFMGEPEHVIG